MYTHKTSIAIAITMLLGMAAALANGTGTQTNSSIFDQLYKDGSLREITIETDLRALIEDRKRDDYQTATFRYAAGKKQIVSYEVELRPRGKFRRRICDFPPVKLKFPKKELKAQGLAKHNELKLVTHCLDDRDESKANILKEYLAYRLYNELTDNGFRAQLVLVTYIDSKGAMAKIRRYGILLEDKEEMAERLGGTLCDNCMNPAPDALMPGTEPLMAMYQYMIGNSDWSLMGQRNLEVVRHEATGKLIPVPYDFDFSGWVNARYAVPNTDHGLLSVRDRVYLGVPTSDSAMKATFKQMTLKKDALMALVRKTKGLTVEERNDLQAYLQSFYDIMEVQLAKGNGLHGRVSASRDTGLSREVMPAK